MLEPRPAQGDAVIEHCRSAALGGHVERCEDCGHSRIADNSCRNRPLPSQGQAIRPKCQSLPSRKRGARRRGIRLAAREADLLPVGYFHLVFTLPAEIAPIAYQNKPVVYDLLFRTAAKTLLTIAPGLVPWRWNIARACPGEGRGYALGALPTRLPIAGARAVPPVPAALSDTAGRRPCGGSAGILRRVRRPAQPAGLCRLSRAAEEEELVRLLRVSVERDHGFRWKMITQSGGT